MYSEFDAAYTRDDRSDLPVKRGGAQPLPEALLRFFKEYGGASFNGGVYRVPGVDQFHDWQRRIAFAFPHYSTRVSCFGFDWLGRVFALDAERQEDGGQAVLMLEPGTGEVLQIPANLESFHKAELTKYCEEVVAISMYKEWISQGGSIPSMSQCIGYRQPLFLGGLDVVENLEVSDNDVYWTICGELLRDSRR